MTTNQRRAARFNKAFGNRLAGPLLSRMPGFGAVLHKGRRSGRVYRTPVKIFRTAGGFTMSLPYGPKSDWVRNVQAAGGCQLVSLGRRFDLVEPRVYHDREQRVIPRPLRPLLARFKAFDFIELRLAPAGAGRAER
ncbi:nitroreductase/quinone reductase family protein [Streptacidiphilus jiangxiensis]|uniref:Deazaflavin-dependent oxidoreductase, nitroreductase family n=1 Tax=Streptacidiphilus jiangxiensis TaxID=235985 RepID=A0A1H7KKE7_STRJI|nr:nitroreductase/quinone reductase family protein [Streptacidiphilus jiangxiensis]SEK86475.1 deazaflavin-dependent oxidoreductase, nitroreductase family [Streptacidiphilus jiangxiensis]